MSSPLVYETEIIKLNKDAARDNLCHIEESVNLLNIEVTAMKSFTKNQMLILNQPKKHSLLEKSLCDHSSENTR